MMNDGKQKAPQTIPYDKPQVDNMSAAMQQLGVQFIFNQPYSDQIFIH